MTGKFVVFEGIDGSGKTTIINRLADHFLQSGYSTLVRKEPTDDRAIGRLIQQYLREGPPLPKYSEALLFIADRYDHTENVLKPALEEYDLVLCSRYKWTTLAYQTEDRWEQGRLEFLQPWAIIPNLAIFLDVIPEIGLRRAGKTEDLTARLERLTIARDNYLYYVCRGELIPLDTVLLSEDEVFEHCVKLIEVILS